MSLILTQEDNKNRLVFAFDVEISRLLAVVTPFDLKFRLESSSSELTKNSKTKWSPVCIQDAGIVLLKIEYGTFLKIVAVNNLLWPFKSALLGHDPPILV